MVAYDDPAAIRDASANARTTPSGQLGPLSWSQNAAPAPMDLRHGLPADVIESPTTLEEARLGSLKAMLARYVGSYIVATFLVGTQNMVSWEGILYDVGNDYLTIYQENRDRYVVSDYYSLKFIEFYDTRRRTFCNAVMESQNGMSGT